MDDSSPNKQSDLLEVLDLGGSRPPRRDYAEREHLVGPPTKELVVQYERDLSPADIAALDLPRGIQPKALVRIHASHHALARCLAAGMKPAQASLVTGYSPARISQLEHDESFVALVKDYRAEVSSVFAQMGERLVNLSLDAMEKLHDLLHEKPEMFSAATLMELVKMTADRTGHGPGQEVSLKVASDFIDRPPRESFDEWQERRRKELGGPEDSLGSTARTTN